MSTVAIIGAGTMGHGIAYVSLIAGYDVVLNDVNSETLERAHAHIGNALDSGVVRGKVTEEMRRDAPMHLSLTTDLDLAVAGANMVIEAAPEILAVKQAIFARVSERVPSDTTIATNTSSLSITSIAAAATSPERVVGMHFFNPVAAMKLVELVRGDSTGPDTVASARTFVESLGKTAIVVGDSPGFATSRLGIVLGLEAMRMLEQGVASAHDIDTAMELGYNHPVGPLKLTDIVGLDVRLAVADHLHDSFGGSIYEAPRILRAMVAAGKLGKKSGNGFYEWETTETAGP
ncbi:MAG: 3-hydroxyacyl-CoA dehydrogenase family protein [Gemmatimonadaceae bacterium]